MPSKKIVILDFDGTITDAEIEGTPLSNLEEGGLAKYPEGIKDSNYDKFKDGQIKISEIKKAATI